MIWKEFKDKVEKAGVKDEMLIDYIDISGHYTMCEKFELTVVIEDKKYFSVH